MFKDVHIQRFRGISDLKLDDFRRINLFVGKNNSCKTTVLESLFILVNPTAPRLPSKTNIFRGLGEISKTTMELFFHNFDFEKKIIFETNMNKIHKTRKLSIKPVFEIGMSSDHRSNSDEGSMTDVEYFQSGSTPRFNGLTFEASFFSFDDKKATYISKLYFEGPDLKMKLPEEYKEKYSGLFLSPEFHSVNQTVTQFGNIVVEKRKDNIVRVLKQIEPSLKDLNIVFEKIFCDLDLPKMLPINVMGSGIFRMLSIILAIENSRDGVIFIDEIENGLYHTSQEMMWNAIIASAEQFNVQIFATTHSSECIRALSNANSQKLKNLEDDIRVYRIERQKEDFKVAKFNQDNIEIAIEKSWDIR